MRSLLGSLLNRAPVPYVGRSTGLSFLQTNQGNAEAQMKAMGSVGTLFAIVTALANNTSRVEWKLWRKAASGDPEDRIEVTRHAALDVWNKPNPWMPRQEFVETQQQHIDLTGEGWWVISRNPASPLPLELWPVRPDRIAPVPDPVKFIAGYVYSSPDGVKVPLGRDEVIFLRMPNPLDIYRGMGPVQSILVDLDATRYTSEWNRNFFLNSSEPGGIIEVDKRLSDVEFDELRERWAEQHRGVAAAHRVALIESGMKWVNRSFSQRDMEFTALREVSRDTIREAFGIPKFAVGDVDDVNRATADASRAWFAEALMVPRLERIKGALNEEFLPLYGPTATDLEFDYEDPVPANREADNAELTARAGAAKTLIDAGFEPTEVLEAVGLPEIAFKGTPITTTTLAGPPAPGAAPAPAGTPPAEGEPAPEAEPAPAEAVPSRRAPAALGEFDPGHIIRQALRDAAEDAQAEAVREDWEERTDALVERWTNEITSAQIDALVEQIEGVVNSGSPTGLADLSLSYEEGAALLAQAMREQATAAAERMAELAAEQGVSISPAVPAEPAPANQVRRLLTPRPTNVHPALRKIAVGVAEDLGAQASLTAKKLTNAFTDSASAEALRVWNPGATAKEVSGKVRDHLEGLTTKTLGSDLSAAIWAAENEGRSATIQQAEEDGKAPHYLLADEVRDKNTCQPCKDIDNRKFDTLAEAEKEYPFGGYRKCEGRHRCRGTYVPYWEQ